MTIRFTGVNSELENGIADSKVYVKWDDIFGMENILVDGGDHVYFFIPDERDEEGHQFIKMISKKAFIEMADKLKE